MLALPLLAGAFARLFSRITGNSVNRSRVIVAASAGLAFVTLLAAWMWRWSGSSDPSLTAVIAGWSSASFFGTPLAIAAPAAGGAAMIAFAATRTAALTDPAYALSSPAISSGLFALGAGMTFLASTTPTLLIGIGLMDVTSVWIAARRSNGRNAVRAFVPQAIGVILAGLALTLAGAGTNSFFIGEGIVTGSEAGSSLLSTLLNIAACAHANILPFGAANEALTDEQRAASTMGALALLQHTPTLEPWALALVLITTAFWALRSAVNASAGATAVSPHERSLTRARQAAAAFALIGAVSGHAHVAAMAWLLGNALLSGPAIGRLIGAFSLAGLPLLPGFVAYAGAASAMIERGGLGAATVVLLTASHALLVVALLNSAFGMRNVRGIAADVRQSLTERLRLAPAALLAAHALLLGVAPTLAGPRSLLGVAGDMGIAGWLALLLALALGTALWRVSSSGFGAEQLERADRLLSQSGRLGAPVLASLDRIRGGFRFVLAVLESDGALLWAGLSVLIALLIARPGTP